jgi:hypothetical protein
LVDSSSSAGFLHETLENQFFDHLIQFPGPAKWREPAADADAMDKFGGMQTRKRKSDALDKSADPRLIYLLRWPAEASICPETGRWLEELVIPWTEWTKMEFLVDTDGKQTVVNRSLSSVSASSDSSVSLFGDVRCVSPFPHLDKFLLDHLHANGQPNAWIRQWKYSNRQLNDQVEEQEQKRAENALLDPSDSALDSPFQYSQLRYILDGTRFCANINRHHKSNGTYLAVYLRFDRRQSHWSGEFVQKCFDPECKSFVPKPLIIPATILNAKQPHDAHAEADSSQSQLSQKSAVDADEAAFERELLLLELPTPHSTG